MQTITREHPGFEQLLNGVIDIMKDHGMDISDVEAFKACVSALIITDDDVLIQLPEGAVVEYGEEAEA